MVKKERALKVSSKATAAPSSSTGKNADWADTGTGIGSGRQDKQNLFVKAKGDSAIKARLLKFYEIYNPAKLDDEGKGVCCAYPWHS